jgi:hypothetical protein
LLISTEPWRFFFSALQLRMSSVLEFLYIQLIDWKHTCIGFIPSTTSCTTNYWWLFTKHCFDAHEEHKWGQNAMHQEALRTCSVCVTWLDRAGLWLTQHKGSSLLTNVIVMGAPQRGQGWACLSWYTNTQSREKNKGILGTAHGKGCGRPCTHVFLSFVRSSLSYKVQHSWKNDTTFSHMTNRKFVSLQSISLKIDTHTAHSHNP